ncbi:hypothetical protein DPM19_21430 [Actinomadura craniellae]|uniref:Uncharacterized protein n=1 Tax=Actinomadura craniellae TaxID=2231787 RepID=A0A365H211_9ACTN|nr:FGLLP motif-containing membrane protein [Actinomadura craniellae]RAY13066.1 hypothetical protein DPM19_21430 [Actinomadura craniellae]
MRGAMRRAGGVLFLAACLALPAWSAPAGAADPQVRGYAGTGGAAASGDPGAPYVLVTVRDATECALPAGVTGPDPRRSRGIRIFVAGERVYPTPPGTDPTEVYPAGVEYAGPDDLLIDVLARPGQPAPTSLPLRLDCADRSGTWRTVIDRAVPYGGHGNTLPVEVSTVAENGLVRVGDIRALYNQPAQVRTQDVTAEVDGRPAQVVPGERDGLMSVRLPAGTGRGLRVLTVRAGGRSQTVPIRNGFATPPPRRAAPSQPSVDPSRSVVLHSVPTLSDLPADPVTGGLSLGAMAVLLLLIGFPSQPFNQTLDEHEEEIRRRLRALLRRPPQPRPRSGRLPGPVVFALFCVLTAGLTVLVDANVTTAGTDALVLFAGFLAAIPLVTLAYSWTIEVFARLFSDTRGALAVLGWAAALAVLCAAVSRLADFRPGYVYGLIAGFVVLREGRRDRERGLTAERGGAAVLVGAISVLLLSVVAYLVLDKVHPAATREDAAIWLRLADAVLLTTFVTGVQGIVFGLLPFRFLDGQRLFAWSRAAWALVYGTGLLIFFYVLVFKHAEGTARGADLLRGLGLFAVFGTVSVLVWGYFRYRPDPAGPGPRGWPWFAVAVVLPLALVIAAGTAAAARFAAAPPPATAAPEPPGTSSPAASPVTSPGTSTAASPLAGPTPTVSALRCERRDRDVTDPQGRTFATWTCPTERRGRVYRTPATGPATGYLSAAENWFACQLPGGPDPDGRPGTWLYTQGDDQYENEGWGWFPASFVSATWAGREVPELPPCDFAP